MDKIELDEEANNYHAACENDKKPFTNEGIENLCPSASGCGLDFEIIRKKLDQNQLPRHWRNNRTGFEI